MYQCMYGLFHLVGSPPVIGILSMGPTYMTHESVGNPHNPSYISETLLPYDENMSFWQRVDNMVTEILFEGKYKVGTQIAAKMYRLISKKVLSHVFIDFVSVFY